MIIDGKDRGNLWEQERHCVPIEGTLEFVKAALAAGYPKLAKIHVTPESDADGLIEQPCSIVGYGPTLRWTWREIVHRPVCSVGGAHDFLIERGVVPDYHVECDPRPHKALGLSPDKRVKYLLASNCHPDLFDKLRGYDVTIWHASENTKTIDDYVAVHDPDTALVGLGNNAGFRAIEVMGQFGHWHQHVFGIDCSCTETRRHAGKHFGTPKPIVSIKVLGRTWYSTLEMASSAEYLVHVLPTVKLEVIPHGDSLMTAMVNEANRQIAEQHAPAMNYGNLSYQWSQRATERHAVEFSW